ncbi:hypothetical protein BSL78_00712 [Apostichopus japonicus]|uniref:Death domain-containing protein n=1 Tax=Stichopus japonicus TaxID=307972 RepID=A0A2G8LQ56_STIJA|nr:hypothetical protein BSL78_00712 [Apostichopus japonicus]
MADRKTNYRTVLADVADELKDDDAKRLAFELPIPRAERDKINDGITLIDEMEKIKMISEDNVDQLLERLKNRRHNVAATKLEGYKKNHITSQESESSSSAEMSHKSKKVDASLFQTLSNEIRPKDWVSVGRKLNISDPKLDNIKEDYSNQAERVYQMLCLWSQCNGREATYEVLEMAIGDAGLKDLQEKVHTYGK